MTEQEFYNKLNESESGKEYLALVHSCMSRSLKPEPGFEIHHIFLTSLGGSNVDENKVKFTVFEHCRAHALIAKAIPCYKTLQPIVMMSNGQVQRLEDLERVTLEEQLEWSKLREKALHQPKPRESVEKSRSKLKGRKLSAEVRSHMGGAGRGRKTINNGTIHKRVPPEELEYWLSQGWVLGRTKELNKSIGTILKGRKSPGKGMKCITKNGQEKKVKPEELEYWLSQGWITGRCRSFSEKRIKFLTGKESYTKGRKRVHKLDGTEILVPKDQVEEYLSRGWLLGTSKQHLQKIKETKNGRS